MMLPDLDDAALKKEIEATMQRYGVASIVYTRDDDGLHAYLHDGRSVRLGWLDATPASARPHDPTHQPASDAALAAFTEYFVRNYPGPGTVIGNPNWHAPKIFRAAKHAIESARASQTGKAAPTPRPMETAPKDGTLVRLLVRFAEGAFEDVEPGVATWTIGQNGAAHHPEDDEWLFAGWDWEQDCFTQGEGQPIGWLPMHGDAP